MRAVAREADRWVHPSRGYAKAKRIGSRWWLLTLILVTLAAWVVKHLLFPTPAPMRLLTATVSVADVTQTVMATGVIQPRKMVSVGAQASGRILALHVALGDQVRKGQLLAEIDPSTQRNALENAEAVLTQDRAQRASRRAALRQAEAVFQRAAATWAMRLTSHADYDSAQATMDVAKADVEALDAQIRAAQIAVDLARVSLGFTKVIAPISGTVVAIVTPEGQTVNAVQAAPTIVKLADLETMTIKARISEADVPNVHPGQPVYFTILADPMHLYYATLRAIEPAPDSIAVDTANTQTGAKADNSSAAIYYNGLFDIPNLTHVLQPSMTAQVNIVLGDAKGALSLPISALGATDAEGRRAVRVVNALHQIESRWIRVGLNDSARVQVLEGLTLGERVVLEDSVTAEAAQTAEAAARQAEGN